MDEKAVLTPAEALEGLRTCYNSHTALLIEADRAGGLRETLAALLGGGERRRAKDDALNAFYADAQGRVEALAALLAGCPEEAGPWAAEALEIMLFYPPKQGTTVDLSLTAVEGLADPLVSFLSQEEAAEILARYVKRTPPRMMLPNQRKLLEQLKAKAGR